MSPARRPRPIPLWRGLTALAVLAAATLLGRLTRQGRPIPDPSSQGGRRPAAMGSVPEGRGTADPGMRDGARMGDSAPGEQRHGRTEVASGVRSYLVGLGLAAFLTAGSFCLSYTHLVYGPAVPVALIVFALAQVGVHLVFFLHLTTAPDNVNNAMALAFGTLIVILLVGGTLWIMIHMNQNMSPGGSMSMMDRG